MLKSYFKVTWRYLRKDLRFTLLNLIGLSTGLACTLLIALWVSDELKMDRFYQHDNQLYQIMENRVQAHGIWTTTTTSGAMAAALQKDFPEIEHITRTARERDCNISVQSEKNIRADGRYADTSFFQVFSWDLLQGDAASALTGSTSIVLSDELAASLFGSADKAVGRTVELQHQKSYQVTGVFRKTKYSSDQFDFVLPISVLRETESELDGWGSTFPYTYILFRPGTNIEAFNAKIRDYVRQKTNNEIIHRTPFAVHFSETYLYGRYEDGKQVGGRIEYVRLFSIIAIVILVIACINFMNLSTAKAAGRAREVGIRKVTGASRGSLVLQYFSESILMALAALVLAILLVYLFLPTFNTITGKQLELRHPETGMVLSALGIALFTGILAGSYPALYLSGFRPALVLKGKLRNSLSELLVRKGLIVFQFALSVILIVSVLVVYRQINYIQTKSLGYDRNNLITFFKEGKLEHGQLPQTFLTAVRQLPGVLHASAIGHSLTGHSGGTTGIHWPGKDPNDRTEFEITRVDYDMLETMGVTMVEGRSFSPQYATDTNKVIFNEAGIKFMGIKDPLGKIVNIWGKDLEIVGVAKDFHFQSLHEKIKPLFFRLDPDDAYRFFIKVQPGHEASVLSGLEQLYRQYNPGFSFKYTFQDENYQKLYAAENRVSVLSRYFAGMAILISCLGLFGLAAFTIQRRSREIGIRKVLGATVGGVVILLSREYLKLILLASLIAFPLAWWMTGQWLSTFVYHTDQGWGVFALAALLVLVLTFLTVSFQSVKAALTNPTKSLKTE